MLYIKEFFFFTIFLLTTNSVLADKYISNLITPVSYFVDHVKQLGDLRE
ncbi:MAG UNVERIFIED_CONTAM: hypothetical protein LVQ98_00835 [Rickettsiaceae bacterium]|jgi:hypothetical protein